MINFIKLIKQWLLVDYGTTTEHPPPEKENEETQEQPAPDITPVQLRNFDRTHFFRVIRPMGLLKQPQVDNINQLLGFMEKDTLVTDLRHFAYMLATIKHETANIYAPIEEYGKGRGRVYGTKDKGTGKTYYGRGYVQLTWKLNYSTMGRLLNEDLLNSPNKALDPDIAYRIMSEGMRKGMFTQHSLSQHINSETCDYKAARRIINGTDKAFIIATYASIFERALKLV